MSKPVLETHQLGKRYKLGLGIGIKTIRDLFSSSKKEPEREFAKNDVWALRDVSFTLEQGEVLGLIGRNGAGKSTLLKLLCRVTQPTEGNAIVRGRVGALLEVGVGFHAELTGRENVYLSGSLLGLKHKEIAKHFDEVIEFAGVERFVDVPIKRYSSGMRVRLGFAVAAILNPDIMILDEVLAVGDMAFQNRCLTRIRELCREGRTVILVSHNIQNILQFCDKALYLEGGHLKKYGDVESVAADYLGSVFNAEAQNIERMRELSMMWDGAHYGTAVHITQLCLTSHHDFMVNRGETIRLAVSLRSKEKVAPVRVGCTVLSAFESPVGTAFCAELLRLEPGDEKTVEVIIPKVKLAPGPYSLAVFLDQGPMPVQVTEFDKIIWKPAFQLNPSASADEMLWHSGFGPVNLGESD